MILLSRIVSYAGLLVAWVGIWMSTSTTGALIISGGMLLLFGGSAFVGMRRRRAAGTTVARDDAQRAYDRLRRAFIANRLGVPVICLLVLIYIESMPGAALVAAGLLVSTLAGIPAERETLARLRQQAETGTQRSCSA